MDNVVTVTYEHNHECSKKGELLEVRPQVDRGVYFPIPGPICLEHGTELELVSVS